MDSVDGFTRSLSQVIPPRLSVSTYYIIEIWCHDCDDDVSRLTAPSPPYLYTANSSTPVLTSARRKRAHEIDGAGPGRTIACVGLATTTIARFGLSTTCSGRSRTSEGDGSCGVMILYFVSGIEVSRQVPYWGCAGGTENTSPKNTPKIHRHRRVVGIPTVEGNIVDGLVAGEKLPESIDKIHRQLTTTVRTSLTHIVPTHYGLPQFI